ncbi:hypothetical protein [Mycetocola lacteus]|uniref:hypothetical protein n=1 Tax=Mycetocola lacteus TaxID=76637 RepID=UPI0011C487EA|nr:hypothetical protein [Mycetocola lacteus]
MTDEPTTPRLTRDEIEAKYGSAPKTSRTNPYLVVLLMAWLLAGIVGVTLAVQGSGGGLESVGSLAAASGWLAFAALSFVGWLVASALRWKG